MRLGYIFVSSLLIYFQILYADNFARIIEAIESQDPVRVSHVFDTLDPLSIEESRTLLQQIYKHYNHSQILTNKEQIYSLCGKTFPKSIEIKKGTFDGRLGYFPLLNNLTSLITGLFSVKKNETSINTLLDEQVLSGVPLASLLYRGDADDLTIPAALVIGGVEMLVGALICVLPFPALKAFGGMVILDGVNRVFNGIERQADQNQEHRLQQMNAEMRESI